MFPRSQTLVIFLLAFIVTISISASSSANLNELLNIQQKFAASIKPQLESYYQELSELEKSIEGQSNPEELNEIRNEIKRVENQLNGIKNVINYKPAGVTPPPPKKIDPPKPEPVITPEPILPHTPQTHIKDIRGLAGAPKFSKNNVYTFNLANTGKNSHVKFYATGRRSTDTAGEVWLIKPDGEKIRITKWKENNFKYSSEEINTYKKLEPITVDISENINGPGLYQIEFQWTDGIDPLVIYRVELTS